MRLRTLILPALAALGLAACSEVVVPGDDTTPIPGNYLVNRVNGNAVPGRGILLTIQPNGSFSGQALCNSFSGTSGRALPGFRAASFKKGSRNCDQNIMRIDHEFFQALTRATNITQGAGGISLAGNDGDRRIRIDAVRVAPPRKPVANKKKG